MKKTTLTFPTGLEWVFSWFQDQAQIISAFKKTSTSAEIIKVLVEHVHKGDLKMEIPMVYVDAVREMMTQRGAFGFVEAPPTPERPFLRFLWRESQIFVYKINEDFAEIICSSHMPALKEEFSNLLVEFLEFLREPPKNDSDETQLPKA